MLEQGRARRALSPRARRQLSFHLAPLSLSSPPTTGAAAPADPIPKIPSSIADVDNGTILGFGPDLAPDHPGYGDAAYAARRATIAGAARGHVAGTPPPPCTYTPAETGVWTSVLTSLSALHADSACREYLATAPSLGFSPAAIPQLADVDRLLAEAGTGWAIRPVAGLMHPRDFLAGLAFRTFHSTQYVRHPSRPAYTPEPDVVHELVGHVPLLMDAHYAAMVHALGVASLGAPDPEVWRLTRLYWYTVEFGAVLQDEEVKEEGGRTRRVRVPKAFGAGILSSPGELAHFASESAAFTPLDPRASLPRMAYKEGYQPRYYSLPSFAEGAEMLASVAAERTPPAVRARFGLAALGAGRLVPAGSGGGTGAGATNSVVPVPRGALGSGGGGSGRAASPPPPAEPAAAGPTK